MRSGLAMLLPLIADMADNMMADSFPESMFPQVATLSSMCEVVHLRRRLPPRAQRSTRRRQGCARVRWCPMPLLLAKTG